MGILFAGNVRAAVLDQSYTATDYQDWSVAWQISDLIWPAQTFRAGIAGTLSNIDVQIYRGIGINASSPPVILEIHPNSPADPTILGSYTIPPLTVPRPAHPTPTFMSVDVSDANIVVNPGDIFAIVARSYDTTGYLWARTPSGINGFDGGPSYADGSTWNYATITGTWKQENNASGDVGFRTFVIPLPEPASGLMLLIGTGVLLRRRNRL